MSKSDHSSPFHTPGERASLLAIVVGLVVTVLTSAVYWWFLIDSHREQLQAIEQQTQLRALQTSKAVATQVETLISGLDFLTQNLSMEYLAESRPSFARAVGTALRVYPKDSILQIAIADQAGNIVYSSREEALASPTNIADREHFRIHAAGSDKGLFISEPVRGRVSQQWSIQLSRALIKDGHFAGVIVISVSPSHFSNFFRNVFHTPNDVIMLLKDNGSYLARSHDEAMAMGRAVPGTLDFLRLYPPLLQGNYQVIAKLDGIPRYYGWSRVTSYPLVISVGLDKAEALASTTKSIRANLQRNLIGTVTIGLFALLVAWLQLQRIRARRELRAKDEQLQKLVAQVPGAIYQYKLSADGVASFPYASPGIADIYELPPEELAANAAPVFERIHPDDREQVNATIADSAQNQTPWECKYRVITGTGNTRWLHGYSRPERLPDGSVLWHGYIHEITQEHAMQQALHDSEERLRLTLNAVQDGLWEWDMGQDSLHWDPRCYEMLGYRDQAFPMDREHFFALIHPRDRDRCFMAERTHLDPGRFYRTEFRLRTATGDWMWVESRGQLQPCNDHHPARMLGTLSDISVRVSQGQVQRALLDQSGAAIFLATPDRLISQANARAAELFSPDGQPLIGQNFQVIHPDEASFTAFGGHYQDLRQNGSIRLEWQLRDTQGRLRWFDVQGTLLDADDPNGGVIWTMLDTDAHHRAMAALTLARQRLKAIIEQFPGGVLVEDHEERRIIVANQVLCQLQQGHQTTPQALVGLTHAQLLRLLPPGVLHDTQAAETDATSQQTADWECDLDDGRSLAIDRIALSHDGAPIGLFWFIRDISERKRRESALAALAATDPLTGLANRRTFLARVADELHDLRRGNRPPGVLLMLDLDHFKRVNDTYGHAAGDLILRHLAALMQTVLRHDDLAGRIGGEEFAILLPHTDLYGGASLAERIRAALETTPAYSEAGPISITASLGVCLVDSGSGSPEDCLARADAALYEAKHQGRNRVVTWSDSLSFTTI